MFFLQKKKKKKKREYFNLIYQYQNKYIMFEFEKTFEIKTTFFQTIIF